MPAHLQVWRAFARQGVTPDMLDDEPPEPVTAVEAGRRLGRSAATIRYWVIRYAAVQLGKQGRAVYYDFEDLASIEWYIRKELPVPTPEARAAARLEARVRRAAAVA